MTVREIRIYRTKIGRLPQMGINVITDDEATKICKASFADLYLKPVQVLRHIALFREEGIL